jgi:hypothetical protein
MVGRSPSAETRGMTSRARSLIAAAITCTALAIAAASASAQDFCVGAPAGCTGTPVPGPLLAIALQQAQANGTDDRFFIAPGVFASTNFTYESTERLQIIGAGAGQTTLTGNTAGSVLTLGGNPDSSMVDLTLQPVGTATGGLTLQGTQAHRVTVDAKGAASLDAGVQLQGDATFDHGSVDIGTAPRWAVIVLSGDGSVTDSTLTAPDGAGVTSAGGEATVRRSTLDAKIGAYVGRGHLTVSDTLIDLRGHAGGGGAIGVYADPDSGGNGTATTDADRLTIVGSTPATAESVGVVAQADGAGKSATAHVRDSVISGIGVPVARVANNGATANLTTSRSAYPSPLASYDTGLGSLVEQDRLAVSPGFGGNGDFHLAAGSRLIDAGTPADLPADAADRDGLPRASDGIGDCQHVSDIGAFEYQGTQARAVATAAAATAGVGEVVGFSAAGSCIPGPGAPAIGWSFDDGATAAGANVTHAFAIAGRHTATVTVTDDHGHSAQATAAVGVSGPIAAAPAPPAPPAMPATPAAPRITLLRVAPMRVQIGSLLPKLVRTTVRRPLGTISFRLSKPATVTLQFAKLARNGASRPLKAKIRVKARKGQNRIRFAARLTRAVALMPGNYRLTAIATDNAGARSKPATTRFRAIGR